MRSRIAITALLATGALLSSTGAAIGVSALSTTGDASQAQYGPVETTTTTSTTTTTARTESIAPSGDTLAGGADVAATPPSAQEPSSGGVEGFSDESTPATAQAQPARQLESDSDGELPFTGYAAIPLLLAGLALLVAGLVLRRGTNVRQLT